MAGNDGTRTRGLCRDRSREGKLPEWFTNVAEGATGSNGQSGSDVEVLRLHYSADPERNLDWVSQERQKYSSRAAWDREQEIIHLAGGRR